MSVLSGYFLLPSILFTCFSCLLRAIDNSASIRGMRRTGKQPVLLGLPEILPGIEFGSLDRSDLEAIRDVLNEKENGPDGQDQPTPLAQALIGLLERLKNSGGNLQKMMNGQGLLRHNVETAFWGRWMPSRTGRAHLVLQPSPQALADFAAIEVRPERFAAMLFNVWTLNPEQDKLAGPCARCGRYYLKRRASQKVYCSRRCGNVATAVARTRKRLADEHADKLRRAAAVAQKWITARTNLDWKHWVAQRERDITPKFLTRAVNKGELKPPTKGKKP